MQNDVISRGYGLLKRIDTLTRCGANLCDILILMLVEEIEID